MGCYIQSRREQEQVSEIYRLENFSRQEKNLKARFLNIQFCFTGLAGTVGISGSVPWIAPQRHALLSSRATQLHVSSNWNDLITRFISHKNMRFLNSIPILKHTKQICILQSLVCLLKFCPIQGINLLLQKTDPLAM